MGGVRRGALIAHNGLEMSASEWAGQLGVGLSTLYDRLKRYGAHRALDMGPPSHEPKKRRDPVRTAPEALRARLLRRTDRSSPHGCWLWQGPVDKGGYGRTGDGLTSVLCHRLNWKLSVGPIPDGMCVCHSCDVFYPGAEYRRCVNPAHLFLADHRTNMADMAAKKRGTKPCDPRTAHGSAHYRAVLDEAAVTAILHRMVDGETDAEIAANSNTGQSNVYAIRIGKAWKLVSREGLVIPRVPQHGRKGVAP